ncbi:uncharacterized protein [Ptychodera flava]|uniref:uncharacterized protein n=1 Tax=Ptychodera flava TaxID=63121 RepID=UPI00396A16FF
MADSVNAQNVTLFGSHEPGSAFYIGNTSVTYTAVGPYNTSASCTFVISVKEWSLVESSKNLSEIILSLNDTEENLVAVKVVENLEKLLDISADLHLSFPEKMEVTESIGLADDILTLVDEGISISKPFIKDSGVNDSLIGHLSEVVLNITSQLSTFVLNSSDADSGPITIEKTSLALYMETGVVEDFCDAFVALGDGNWFEIPAHGKLNFTSGYRANLIINQKTVADVEESIGITFGNNHTYVDTYLEGTHLEDENSTYFEWKMQVSQHHGAILIVFKISETIAVNTTVLIAYLDSNRTITLSRDVKFSGSQASIFMQEPGLQRPTEYHLSLTLPLGLQLSVLVKQQWCGSFNRQTGSWDSEGCKASTTPMNDSILCLCDHLT